MVFDAGILPERMQVNLVNLIGGVYDGILVSGILHGELDREADFLRDSGCRGCKYEFESDFEGLVKAGAELLPHLLGQEFPEHFGRPITGGMGAITIETARCALFSGDCFSSTA